MSDDRAQTLARVRAELTVDDVRQMGRELRISNADAFIREMSESADYFDPGQFKQFCEFVRSGLR